MKVSKILKKNIKNFVDLKKNIFYGWGRKKSGLKALELAKKYNSDFLLLEDGFIRSVGLGVDGWEAFSIVEDDIGIYYDATGPSRLEKILKNYDFRNDKGLIETSKKAIELIKKLKISKYNLGKLDLPEYLKEKKKRVLIVAQTKGDMSLKYGYANEKNAKKMLFDAIKENRDAEIYLKIHPDVLSGKKESNIDIEFAKRYCKIITENIHPIVLLEAFDKVYTQTSQMGFEALLLDKEVNVYGAPFYVGWGIENIKWRLEEDIKEKILKRRGRKLSIEEVFAGAYILYCKYYNPYRKRESDIMDTINEINLQRKRCLTSKNRYLAIGDSHIRVFESKWFKYLFPNKKFNVVYVPGATAYGINNINSKTQAYNKFVEALEKYDYEKIIVTLGEVDCSFTLWGIVQRNKKNVEEYFKIAVERYKNFLKFLTKYAPVIVISPSLPTVKETEKCNDTISGIRKQINVSQKEKTKLTLKFNEEIKEFVKTQKDIKYIDFTPMALDKKNGIIKHWLKNIKNPCDHHYQRWKFALLLIYKLLKERVL